MQLLLENLYKAYFEARKNKRHTKEQLLFEINYEERLHELYESITSRTYEVSPCKAFVIEKPVYREIFAPQFADRVVHHLIAMYLLPAMERGIIEDTYSCRKGKGTLYGINRGPNILPESDNCQQLYWSVLFYPNIRLSGWKVQPEKGF